MGDLDLTLRLKADGSGLIGTVRVSRDEVEKLGKTSVEAGKTAADGIDQAVKATMTWHQFLKQRMGPLMKEFAKEGRTNAEVHTLAIRKISKEWKEYKKSGQSAHKAVEASGKKAAETIRTSEKEVKKLGKTSAEAGKTAADGIDQAVKATMTWHQFLKQRMGPLMKEFAKEGRTHAEVHTLAIRKISKEWKEYKKTGQSAHKAVEASGKKAAETIRTSEKEVNKLSNSNKNLDKSGRKAAAGTDKFSKSGQRAGNVAKNLNRELKNTAIRYFSIAAAAAALVLGLKNIISTGADFNQQMANVASVSGASADELDRLKNAARDQAKVSIFSARQAAEAQYFLASAGLDVNQIISAQSGIMSLAAATQSDLAQTSEITTATLAQFNFESSESIRVANVFAASISGSQATLQKLGDAMRYVGPVANSLEIDLESITAAMSLLFTAGFRGEQVGTALRASLVSISKDAGPAADKIKEMGLEINDASGRFVGFESLIRQLSSSQLDLNAAVTLFGSEAAPAMLALVNKGVDEFIRMRDSITGTNKALEMEKEQLDELSSDWKLFKSATEEAYITLENGMEPTLRSITQTMTAYVGAALSGVATLLKIAAAGGTAYLAIKYLPGVLSFGATAWTALNLQSAIFFATAKSGVPIMTLLNTSLFGTSISATAAAGAIGKLKIAAGVLFAAFAGWEIGTWMRDNFVEARVAGLTFVGLMLKGWEYLKLGGKIAFAAINSGWNSTLNGMKSLWAGWVELIAKGMSYLPNKLVGESVNNMNRYVKELRGNASDAETFEQALARLNSEHEANIKTIDKNIVSLTAYELGIKTGADAANTMKKNLKDLGSKSDKTGKQTSQLTKEQNDFMESLREEARLLKFTGKELDVQTALSRAHALGINDQDKAVRDLVERMYDLRKVQRAVNKSAEPMAQIYKDTARSIRQSFRDTFRSVMDNGISGFKGFSSRILDVFKNMLADMLTLSIARPIIIPMVAGVGGMLGVSQSAQASVVGQLGGNTAGGLSNAFNLAGMGSNLLGAGAGIMGSIGGGITAAGGFLGSGIISGIGSGLTMGAANFGAAGLIGGAGANLSLAASSLSAGAMGTAIGAFMSVAGPIAAAAMAIDAITGGAIFGGKKKLYTQGLDLGVSGSDISGRQFAEFKQKRSIFSGGGMKRTTQYKALTDDMLTQLQGGLDATREAIGAIGDILNKDLVGSLDSFQSTYKGKSKGVAEWMQNTTANMFRQAFSGIPELQGVVDRVDFSDAADAFAKMNFAAKLVSGTLFDIDSISKAKSAISALNNQFDALKNQAEDLGLATGLITDELSNQLVKMTTDFNQSIRDQITAITNPLQLSLDAQARAAEDRLQNARDLGANLVEVERLNALEREQILKQSTSRLNDFVSGLGLSTFSTATPGERLSIAQDLFSSSLSSARMGNSSAITSLPEAAQQLLTEGRSFYAGTAGFQDLFTQVNRDLSSIIQTQSSSSSSVADQLQINGSQQAEDSALMIIELKGLRTEVASMRLENERLNDALIRIESRASA